MESLTPSSSEYANSLADLMSHLHSHNDSEEQKDLPLLEPTLGESNSAEAAQSFSRTKKFVPTHPHPSVPNRPPLETIAGFMAAPIDKLREMFLKFPTDEMKS